MVWGGISLEAKTELHIFGRASINAQVYVESIVQDYIVPYSHFIGEDFLLMHDNARPHAALCVREYLQDTGIPTLQWPARSPDLNPIEHLWDQMARNIQWGNIPRTLPLLRNALHDEWERIQQPAVEDLIRSMPRRIRAVITARGGNTKY